MFQWGIRKKKSNQSVAGGTDSVSTAEGPTYGNCTEKPPVCDKVLSTHFEEGKTDGESDDKVNTHEIESYSTSATARDASPESRHHSIAHGQRKHRLTRQPNSTSSLTECRSAAVDCIDCVRQRTWSSLSNASPPSSSYLTPSGSLNKLNTVPGLSSVKNELLQSVKELLDERLGKLEKKMEESQRQLEAKVDDIEQRLQTHIDITTRPTHRNGVELQAELPPVKEVTEGEDEGEVKNLMHSPSLPSSEEEWASRQQRLYTDSDSLKMARYRAAMKKRQEYAKRKYLSFQDPQLLPTSCDQQVIVWLTQRLTNWKFIARWLGLQENEISRIMADNPLSDREQCYQMFLRWRETDPENYTYPVLGQALKKESLELYNEYVREVHHVENSTELNTQQST